MSDEKFFSGLDVAYLASCVLANKIPDADQISTVDYSMLYKQSARQSMQGAVYLALKGFVNKNGTFLEGLTVDLLSQFERDYKIQTNKMISLTLEREKLITFMEDRGIWYLPLKGIILQNFYPQIGIRQMADNDILFDIKFRKDIKKFMVESGYEVASYGKGVHDTYYKKPFCNFELHAYLYRESVNPVFDKYYSDVKSRLIKDADNLCGYHFSDEDFYIHTLTHIYKHYSHGGLGIRFLMDIYVSLESKGKSFNWDYINSELEKLGISGFARMAETLSQKLFSFSNVNYRNDLTSFKETEINELRYFIHSGIYGTKQNAIDKDVEKINSEGTITKNVRFKYLIRRLFPSLLYYKENYPFFYKYKIFIPFFVIYRMTFKSFVSRENIKTELKLLKNIKRTHK